MSSKIIITAIRDQESQTQTACLHGININDQGSNYQHHPTSPKQIQNVAVVLKNLLWLHPYNSAITPHPCSFWKWHNKQEGLLVKQDPECTRTVNISVNTFMSVISYSSNSLFCLVILLRTQLELCGRHVHGRTWALRLFFHSCVSRALKRPLLSEETDMQRGRWALGGSWGVRATGTGLASVCSLLLIIRFGQEPGSHRRTCLRSTAK